jgi:hypothetical protein
MKNLPPVVFGVTVVALMLVSLSGLPFRYVAYTGFDLHAITQVVVSGVLGGAALFIILSKRYGPKDTHWAYATLGTLLGFWLR